MNSHPEPSKAPGAPLKPPGVGGGGDRRGLVAQLRGSLTGSRACRGKSGKLALVRRLPRTGSCPQSLQERVRGYEWNSWAKSKRKNARRVRQRCPQEKRGVLPSAKQEHVARECLPGALVLRVHLRLQERNAASPLQRGLHTVRVCQPCRQRATWPSRCFLASPTVTAVLRKPRLHWRGQGALCAQCYP